MSDDPECPGAGKCHGCANWCADCGDVDHICDMRLRGDRCDAHPVPPTWHKLREQRAILERKHSEARDMIAELEFALLVLRDEERARRAFDLQVAADERKVMGT